MVFTIQASPIFFVLLLWIKCPSLTTNENNVVLVVVLEVVVGEGGSK